MKVLRTCCTSCCLVLFALGAEAQTPAAGGWDFSGDLRAMYAASWRDTRAGEQTDGDTFGSRLRMRLRNDLNDNWRVQGRFATSYEDKGNDAEFFIRSARESATDIEPGSMTLDELFVQYRSDDRRTEFRLGRMQSSFTLPLITGKSLDRNQASNINVGWTDGVYLGRELNDNWKVTLTGQYNSRDGNGIVTRGPLEFSDSGSRVSAFATLESDAEIGPVFLRALTLTWYPDALAVQGLQSARREDYTTATFKMAAGWDVSDAVGTAATRLVVAGSVGQAFNQPDNAVMGIPERGDADGFGWQLGADLQEIFPRHTVGVVFGQADAGWLISNDFRQNDSLAELRWSWQVTDPFRLQFRARWRQEQELRAGAVIAQRDRDMRLRATWKF
ncbi:MAG: hypothetical protein WD397_03130 [Wenzhouxiangellaceae bacterium]